MFLAIATDLVQDVVAPLAEAVEHAQDLRETLTAFGRRVLTILLCPTTIALFRLVTTEIPRFPELGRAFYDAGPERAVSEFASYLREQRQLQVSDPELAARQYLALIVHPIELKAQLGLKLDSMTPEVIQHLEAAVDTFMRAYGPLENET